MKTSSLGQPLIKLAVRFEQDIVTARQKTRRLSQLLGFDTQDQARLATGVSELSRNIFQYAGSGQLEYFLVDTNPQRLTIKASDSGPGIVALEEILNGTYVSKNGMGIGLMGTKKIMDDFKIESRAAQGTTITITKILPKTALRLESKDLRRITDQLIIKQAENPFEEIQNQNRDLLTALDEVQATKEELAELNRELAETNRGVVALYAELDEKAVSLQKANEIKTSFLSNMTHEFRTPLSSVISLTRLLLSRVDGELTPEQEKQVHYIRQSSEGLLELVNDLLDLAKVEAGKISINSSQFHIEEVLSSLRGMFRPLLNNNSAVEFLIEGRGETFELKTDQAKISQILRNLISNAFKFTEKGSVTLTTELQDNGLIHFTVTDTGMGIEPQYLKVIFDDFSQVDSYLQKKQRGTGLGLPLSRKLARLLGGDLWVESQVGKGSIFHITIPRVYTGSDEGILISSSLDSSTIASADNHFATEVSEKFRVLVIDDDEPSRYVLKSMVSHEIDANFLEAQNGKIGLEFIKNWNPDLVFLDISMPETDGFEVLRAIRQDANLHQLPVVINTAKKLSEGEIRFLEKEATAVLSKEERDDHQAKINLKQALQKAGFDYKNR